INEYKQEAFGLFEKMLDVIREDVTRILMTAEFRMQPPEPMADFSALPELPDFLTNPGFLASHVDPLTGEDDARPIPSAASAMGLLGAQGPGQVP
ncbi:hypothetical protein ACI4B7_26245, partial [Klebsiella pneumoniae]|uniref:hypothetical protein n=1 Tax=Klebsiella pneumoniae TaxID=573 RepID=UPI003851C46A